MKRKNILHASFFLMSFGIFNFIQTNQFALISIPKCGTYLLLKTLRSITGNTKPQIEPKGWTLITDAVMNTFFKNQLFLVAHAFYVDENIKKLNNKNIKTFFIYRDPRDQIVSTAFFIKKPKTSWKLHSKWDLDQLIDELITKSLSEN